MHAVTSHFGGRLLALFQRAAALTSAQAGKRCRVKIRSSLLVQFLQLKSCIQHIDTCRQRLLLCEYAFEQGSMSLGVLAGSGKIINVAYGQLVSMFTAGARALACL